MAGVMDCPSFSSMVGVIPKPALRVFPRCDGGMLFCKSSKKDRSAVSPNDGYPLLPRRAKVDAHKAAGVTSRNFAVEAVFSLRHIAQIADAVIRSVAVDVINSVRIIARHHLPDHAMGQRPFTCNPHVDIAIRPIKASGNAAGVVRVESRVSGALPPNKATLIGENDKQLVQSGKWGQFKGSHVVSPHVRGQGLALLTQRLRPAFSNTAACFAQDFSLIGIAAAKGLK